ncbi:ABC transporter ATP-binding protein [Clostridium tarantellae]|uniref:ATP-binding cassette domain-containing protein n=1 Tax=Clostridium tarantellae TaxID=39493 RepID=A0A6I1MKR1_9CLOT|nr:ABC transporter ATP-binding protein [Clostridium tarantellae]MPQ43610.1 ATP-binding cassette domain-containing protein [Clostridium tarantellae]
MKSILELKNVSKIIGNKTLVEDLTFQVNKGEIFGFLGPNGAGKTTTIKMITGLYSISKGEIYIDGNNVKKNFEKALQGIGAIIENPEMYGYLSGMDNLKIYARMHGNISKQRIDEIVNLVKLEKRIYDKVKKYSLGMRQRLGVAQALLHKPKLLILDEPTNGLDPMGIKELRQTLRELAEKEELSVLVSSHLLSEMELMCDRFGIIDSGKIIGIKTIKDIKKNESDEKKEYLLDVCNKKKAIQLVKENYEKIIIKDSFEGIKIECSKEIISKINSLLVKNNIDVFEISILSKTLEEEFLEITKGSKTQIR